MPEASGLRPVQKLEARANFSYKIGTYQWLLGKFLNSFEVAWGVFSATLLFHESYDLVLFPQHGLKME